MTLADEPPDTLYEGLVRHGLIVPVGAPGAFGRAAEFEHVLDRLDARLSQWSRVDGAEVYTFPPVLDRAVLERLGYMHTFPQLCGAVCSFGGDEAGARALSARIDAGRSWTDLLDATSVVLNPAACYPVYPSLAGRLPRTGRLITMLNWVYRHEPSPDPMRMQSFRVREFVCAGRFEQVAAWRDLWLSRATGALASFGLPVEVTIASDAFFGRAGKVLAGSQEEQRLKLEIVTPIVSGQKPTALCSLNLHRDHFSSAFGIRTSDGDMAETACVGFGLERIVMALFATHGFEVAGWPGAAREGLGMNGAEARL